MRRYILALLLSGFGVVVNAVGASAQTITGRVIDAVTQEGIGVARVTLIGANGVVAATSTDSAGYFVLRGVPGLHRLEAEHLGYAKRTDDPLQLRVAETTTVLIRMAPQGILLPPIDVTYRGGFERGRDGFARRMALGRGVFFNPDSIMLREPIVATDAFHGIPGVTVSFYDHVASMTGGKCLTFFVDNKESGSGLGPSLNQLLDVKWIKGIEIYRNMGEIPHEMRTAARLDQIYPRSDISFWNQKGEPCGIVWIWTHHGW